MLGHTVAGTRIGTRTISHHHKREYQESPRKHAVKLTFGSLHSDILHPNRPNIAKDELRDKLASLYKASKDQVSVFGLRTQFGGGKTTGFALVYDSPEAMKKFEPHYRLVRVGLANKIEKASRQQRMSPLLTACDFPGRYASRESKVAADHDSFTVNRQAAQEPTEDSPRYCEGQGCQGQEGEIDRLAPLHPLSRPQLIDPTSPRPIALLLHLERHASVFRAGFWSGNLQGLFIGFGWQILLRAGRQSQAERRIPYLPRWPCPL